MLQCYMYLRKTIWRHSDFMKGNHDHVFYCKKLSNPQALLFTICLPCQQFEWWNQYCVIHFQNVVVVSRVFTLFIYFLIFSTQLFSTQLFFVFHATLVLPDRKQQCLHTSTKIILMLENHATNSSSDLGFQYFSLIYQNLKEKFVSDSTTHCSP